MVKRVLFILAIAVVILICCSASFAAPAYGTHMPESRRWTAGLEADFIIDRNLDNEEGGTNGSRYFFTLSYGISPWLSFDGKIGVGDVDWERTRGYSDISYSTDFAGAYGFRIKGYGIEEWGVRSIVGFQHISVHPDARNQGGNKHETIIDEWQGSVIVSKRVAELVPYFGARYGSLDFIKWVDEKDRKRIQSERYCGLIIGLDYWLNDMTKINLEGAFLDGEEVAIGISYDF